MLFNKLHPNAQHGDRIISNGDDLCRASETYPCYLCENESYWISLSFKLYFCSEECLARMWDEYFEAASESRLDEIESL